MMDMPVVAAARFKGHVVDAYLRGGQRRKVALPGEILRVAVVGRADGEHHRSRMRLHGVLHRGGILRPDLLGHIEGCPGLGPARIEGRMGQNFRDFLLGDAVLPGGGQVIAEGRIHQPLGHQRRYRDQRAVAQRELVRAVPDLPEEHVVIQLGKFRGEGAQGVASRGLFDRHGFVSFHLIRSQCVYSAV